MNYNFLPITKPFPKWTEERFYGLKSSEAQFFTKHSTIEYTSGPSATRPKFHGKVLKC